MCCRRVNTSKRHDFGDFQPTDEWHTEEETDSETELANPNQMMVRSRSTPNYFHKALGEAPPMGRARTARTGGYSLQERIKDWHRSSVPNPKGEAQAEEYCNMMMGDTLKHLNRTVRMASSIVEKGTDINQELARQEHVLLKAENDLCMAEYETDQATETLRGMSSLTGKLSSIISKKEPKLKVNPFSNINMDLLDGEPGLCAFSRMSNCQSICSSKVETDTQKNQLKQGMGNLHQALDIIASQQMDAAWALERQEGRLSVFENQMSTTQQKINCQSQLMNKIMAKS